MNALEFADYLETNGEGCDCYARSRAECGCNDAKWPEDVVLEAAKELRRLHKANADLLFWMKYIQSKDDVVYIHNVANSAVLKAKGETK